MELLQINAALKHMKRVLKPTGELWLSFQWDGEQDCQPTAHQNVFGSSKAVVEKILGDSDLQALTIEECRCAFYTPSSNQDGTLMAVPYLFVVAKAKPQLVTVMSAAT